VTHSPSSPSASDGGDDDEQGRPHRQTPQSNKLVPGTALSPSKQFCMHLEGRPRGKVTEALNMNDSSAPPNLFLSYSVEIIALLVMDTNHYYPYYLENPDG